MKSFFLSTLVFGPPVDHLTYWVAKKHSDRECVRENETCLSCRYVPAELSLIKREIGSLHFPPLSLILLILRRRGICHFSPLKKKQLALVKWTKNRCVRRYLKTHTLGRHIHTHTHRNLNSCAHTHARLSPAPCQIPIALFQHCSTSLMIAQLPQHPYTTLRGGEICQTGTGPLLTSHTTVFDSQLGNSKIKGLGKWNSLTQRCESKQTLPWEVVEEEWTRCSLRKNTEVKWKLSEGKKRHFYCEVTKVYHLAYNSCMLGIDYRAIASLFHLEKENALYKSSFMSCRTLLTSFDNNSLWHKMLFSQRSHIFFYFFPPIWCDLVDGAGDCGVMYLSSVIIIITDYWCYV